MVEEHIYNSDKQASFLTLFVKNQKYLYNFILSLCPNYTEADDILQETTTLMWEKYEQLEDPNRFLAWATQIARYKIMNHRRKKTAGLWLSDEVLNRISETQRSVKAESKRAEALQECLLKLSLNERQLIALRYEQGKSFSTISKIVNRSINGLYNTAAKIHQKLRLCISRNLKQLENV